MISGTIYIEMEQPGERAGANLSFWERTAQKFYTKPLTENLIADVCIIGAGIAGVTTAYLLAREGRDVVLIDDGPVGGRMTGRTTAHRAGLREVERVDDIPVGKFTTDGVLRFPRQAQFHPLKYLNGVARATTDRGSRIFTETRVVKVEDGDQVRIETSKGYSIRAQAAIVATNCPINDRLVIHSKQAPYSTYVLALRVTREVEHLLLWETAETAEEEKQTLGPIPYHYLRFARDNKGDV